MSNFGNTTFTATSTTNCKDLLVARIKDTIANPVSNEILLSILLDLIQCTDSGNSENIVGSVDGVLTSVILEGNLATFNRSNGLPPITANINLTTNTSIVNLIASLTTLSTTVATNETNITSLQTSIASFLSVVNTGSSISGDGTLGNPLEIQLSADLDNIAEFDGNGHLLVRGPNVSTNVVEYLATTADRLALPSPSTETIYTVLDSDGNGLRESFTYSGSAWITLSGPVASAPGNMLIYSDGNLLTKADGLGVTYTLAGNEGTITVPLNVIPDKFRINESFASIGNSEIYFLKIINNSGIINENINSFFPYNVQIIERDLLIGDLPTGNGIVFQYEAGSKNLSTRATIDIYEINTIDNYILYRFTNLGQNTKWSILLS